MPDLLPPSLEGQLVSPAGARYTIVAARFNSFIVERLVEGALDALLRHGASRDHISVIRVPGAWEVPVAVARVARAKKADAIIALGAVIRGSTPHFDYVASEIAKGVAHIQLDTGLPCVFGVLTTDTIEQAVERAGTKAGNKGFDAACTAIEMASLGQALSAAGC
jgi:6,7-dimethyl-8-ribityllumazine synthase